MTTVDPNLEEKLRQGFKQLNKFMLLMWRLGLGRWINFWPEGTGRIMVITHTGRKTGLKRQTPVNYALVDGDIYCTAGFGQISDWYRNIMANPTVEVWLPDGWWEAVAEDVTDDEEVFLPALRQVIIASGFAGRAAGLDAVKMSDYELREAAQGYRLIRIRPTMARTGPGGPGDLAWVWPLVTMLLLPMVLSRRRKRR